MINIHILHILHRDRIKKTHYNHFYKPPFALLSYLFTTLFSITLLFLYLFYRYIITDMPDINEIPKFFEPPSGLLFHPTRIYDRSGRFLLFTFSNPSIKNVQYYQLSQGNYLKAEELFLSGMKLYIEINQNTLSYVFLVFEGLAAVSAMLGDYVRAACLFSAADKLFMKVGNLLAKQDITSYQKRLNALRLKMDNDTFKLSWDEGSSMSLKHAIGYALDDNKYDRTMANKMITYIEENYARDISLNDIAEHFNRSASYLSTMFKYYTGKNFKEYLNLYRIKVSKELMQTESNLKIGEIAKRVGCNGSVTFIRMFRKYEGMSPGQYYSKLTVNEK